MIDLIIVNECIHNLVEVKFGKDKKQNLLSYLILYCSHQPAILTSVCIDNNQHIKDFEKLLKAETGNDTRYGEKEHVIHQMLLNNTKFEQLILYFNTYYWSVFIDCQVFRYIFEYKLNLIANYIKIPEKDVYETLNTQIGSMLSLKNRGEQALMNYKQKLSETLPLLVTILKQNSASIAKITGYDSFGYYWFEMILKSSDFMLFCDFLDMIPDINQEIESCIKVKDTMKKKKKKKVLVNIKHILFGVVCKNLPIKTRY
eukprot:550147_1